MSARIQFDDLLDNQNIVLFTVNIMQKSILHSIIKPM